MSDLAAVPCDSLPGVGPALKVRLEKLGITSLLDLLFHLPLHYQDRTTVTPIRALKLQENRIVEGTITENRLIHGKRTSLICKLTDGTDFLGLRFFHFNASQKQHLKVGTNVRVFGEVRQTNFGREMIHPEYTVIRDGAPPPLDDTLTPIYPTVQGLSQKKWRQLIHHALAYLQHADVIPDYLPDSLLTRFGMPSLVDAIRYVHNPPTDAHMASLEAGEHLCQKRLVLEELLAHHLSLRQVRHKVQTNHAPALAACGNTITDFTSRLPFQLTDAQQRVVTEVLSDLEKAVPMMRLVQGDVGAGKTVVAAIAALRAIENGYQVALMAPTEILAEQHFRNFHAWFEPLGFKVTWLSGRLSGKPRRSALEDITLGLTHIVVGTHALFQKEVSFSQLGLIVIDEQHRFGVAQRKALQEKGRVATSLPHSLIMTATPIPRTLSMLAYGDLDCSVIDELPPGRKPINTVVIPNHRRAEIIERVDSHCDSGQQVFWVCPLIETSEVLNCEAAEDLAADLTQQLAHRRIGLIHGRMPSDEKDAVMAAFLERKLDILVATTVIEVGVDVPNATLMIIENAERLGLSQLHQLRGRVGRGSTQSHCVLLYQSPLTSLGKERLSMIRSSHDGFAIARKDLHLRGPGEILGTRQAGLMRFRIADLQRDKALLGKVKILANHLQQHRPDAIPKLIQRWCAEGVAFAGT